MLGFEKLFRDVAVSPRGGASSVSVRSVCLFVDLFVKLITCAASGSLGQEHEREREREREERGREHCVSVDYFCFPKSLETKTNDLQLLLYEDTLR